MFLSPQDSQEKNANPVKAEEAKLKAKYPGLGQKPGGSDFLMKRLQKGVGDYDHNMVGDKEGDGGGGLPSSGLYFKASAE